MSLNVKITKSLLKSQKADVHRETGAYLRKHEEKVLDWIVDNVGGKIVVLKKNEEDHISTPDLRMMMYAEIKTTSGTLNTLDKHVRQACKQTGGGWLFIDITGAGYSDFEAIATIQNRMLRNGLSDTWIIRDGKLVARITLE